MLATGCSWTDVYHCQYPNHGVAEYRSFFCYRSPATLYSMVVPIEILLITKYIRTVSSFFNNPKIICKSGPSKCLLSICLLQDSNKLSKVRWHTNDYFLRRRKFCAEGQLQVILQVELQKQHRHYQRVHHIYCNIGTDVKSGYVSHMRGITDVLVW